MTRYTVHTEATAYVEPLVAASTLGATVLTGRGYWQGTSEPAAMVVVLDLDDTLDAHVRRLAENLAVQPATPQCEVLVVEERPGVLRAWSIYGGAYVADV